MDPITIAMGLAQFAPQIVRWISGEKAGEAADKIIEIANTVTGATGSGVDAFKMIKADPSLIIAFREAVLNSEVELDKAFLADRQDARKRDIELAKAGFRNRRADVMVALDVFGLVSCLVVLVMFKGQLPGEVVGILSTVAGIFGACLRDAHQFEFGSSRGSQEKSELLAKISKS